MFRKIPRKTPVAMLRSASLFKKETLQQLFYYELSETFEDIFFNRASVVAASPGCFLMKWFINLRV